MKVYYRPGHDWLERDEEFAKKVLNNPKSHWVMDTKHDVLCVVNLWIRSYLSRGYSKMARDYF